MSRRTRRSSWESTGARPRRRPRRLVASALSGAVAAALVVGTVVGFEASPALALCSSGGDTCVNTASPTSSVSILPIAAGSSSLTLSNEAAAGTARVGIIGYLRGGDPTRAEFVDARLTTSVTVRVSEGGRRAIRLTDVPAGAGAIMLQVGGTESPTVRSSWRPSTGAGAARLDLAPDHDAVTRSQVRDAVRGWAARTASAMPSPTVLARLADRVAVSSGTPAHLAAAIAPAAVSLTVGWRLQAGSEQVTAVRVTRDGAAAEGSPLSVDRPARSGSLTLDGLVAGRRYTVDVAPVIDGVADAPITMRAVPLPAGATSDEPAASPTATAAPSASASTSSPAAVPTGTPTTTAAAAVAPTASAAPSTAAPSSAAPVAASASVAAPLPVPTAPSASSAAPSASPAPSAAPTAPPSASAASEVPSAPAGYSLLFAQDFSKPAAPGGFTSVYPGYSGYDGGRDTSEGAGRPAAQVGVWDNDATSSVSDGVYRCHLFTQGSQPQLCALTPTPDGRYWSGQLHGRYSVRFKSDSIPGYKIAWLLWPSSDDWSQGEIDFPEGALDASVTGSVHAVTGDPSRNAYFVDTKRQMHEWQTATIDWQPGRVTFVLDDQSWTTTDPSGIPTRPMRWALQAETQIAAQAPSTSAAGDLQIDWLAAYRFDG